MDVVNHPGMALEYNDLNDADKAILKELRKGRNIPSNLASDLDYSREYMSNRLKRLREHEIVRNIGGGVYELVHENVPAPPGEDIADDGSSERTAEEPGNSEPDVGTDASHDLDAQLPVAEGIDEEVWNVVDELSQEWEDDARLETRKKAAATALQYALTHDVHLGKSSDAVEAIHQRFPVEGQNHETWWRKNVRAVLEEVGDYSKGHHGYSVESLEGEHGA